METKDNMKLWNQVSETNPAITKAVTFGRNFTAVCAQSQIKRATELWGPIGKDWGVKDEKFNIIESLSFMYYEAILFYPGGQHPIHSDDEIIFRTGKRSGNYNEDITKKLATDALTKGLSKLGFNSDIFEGKFEDNKYVAEMNKKFNGSSNDKDNKKPKIKKPTEAEQKVIDAIVAKLQEDADGKTVSASKVAAVLYASKGRYPADMTKVGTIATWLVTQGRIDGLCEDIKQPDDDPFPFHCNKCVKDFEKPVDGKCPNCKSDEYYDRRVI